jgi:hypothetical protein
MNTNDPVVLKTGAGVGLGAGGGETGVAPTVETDRKGVAVTLDPRERD